jgi:hypothetical protein
MMNEYQTPEEAEAQRVRKQIDTDLAALWAKTPNDPFWIEFAIKQRELLAAEKEVYGSID